MSSHVRDMSKKSTLLAPCAAQCAGLIIASYAVWWSLTCVYQSAAKQSNVASWTSRNSDECRQQLQDTLTERLRPLEESHASSSAEETWNSIKDTTYKAATEVLGYTTHKHKDWFDEQDLAARALLDAMYSTHLEWINDKSNAAKKLAYTRAKQSAQVKLREMKERWWVAKAKELQSAADRHDVHESILRGTQGCVRTTRDRLSTS